MEIYYINRKTGKKEKEIVAGNRFIKWIYETNTGNMLLEAIIKRKVFSTLYGKLQDFSFSKRKISSFVQKLAIDMGEAEIEDPASYKSFNDFFIRKLKLEARPIDRDKNSFVSPADGRILAYENIDIDHMIQIKGYTYSLRELFHSQQLAEEYKEGTCIVVRLCPADYHRFHFPDGGIPDKSISIKGQYYSVNPISLKRIERVYCQNKREITLFQSDYFDQIALVEVGATCVGSIVQTYQAGQRVEKGQEKGYFKFGGSTVIVFIKRGIIKVDQDIIENTNQGIETKVNMGERIARLIK